MVIKSHFDDEMGERAEETMARKGAEGHSFQTQPFPERYAALEFNAVFSTDEMCSICEGLLPEEMEDKWLIVFTDGDCRVRFYRSWTGYCIYEMGFVPGPDGESWLAHDVRVSREPEQYQRVDDAEDLAILNWMIRNMLLEQWTEPPLFDDPLQAWAEFGNASLGPARGLESGARE